MDRSAKKGPDFLIIGGMKCGTTSLHRSLSLHSDIFTTEKKELHYWDQKLLSPIKTYHDNFNGSQSYLRAGESTPSYCFVPEAASRIFSYSKEIDLIFVLREPVERTISHVMHVAARHAKQGNVFDVNLALKEALVAIKDQSPEYIYSTKSFLQRSTYIYQIRRFRNLFPENQIHILKLEDLKSEPATTLSAIQKFLQVPIEEIALPHSNRTNRRGAVVTDDIVDSLTHYFSPFNRMLKEETGVFWN